MDAEQRRKIDLIITESGNNFHYKIVKFLRSKGWMVSVSPYYNDGFTEKPREIDIIAENIFPVQDLTNFLGTVTVRLFIECKYIKEDTVFWFDDKDKRSALHLVTSHTPLKSSQEGGSANDHRYLSSGKVAKLFTSQQNRTAQSPDGEVMHKAITQSLNAFVSYKNQPSMLPKLFQCEEIGREIRTDMQLGPIINYPIVVCDSLDKFYSYDANLEAEPVPITDNFQMEIKYAYYNSGRESKNEYFVVDIASESNLEQLLTDIKEKDIKAIRNTLSWDHISRRR